MQLMTTINSLHAEVTRWGGIYMTCVHSFKLGHSHGIERIPDRIRIADIQLDIRNGTRKNIFDEINY